MKLFREHKIYILLTLILLLIRISPYSCGNATLDMILNELAVGGVASTLVAWLIFLNEEKKLKKKNESLKLVILHPFANALLNYMQQFCHACSFMPPEDRSRKETFSKWIAEYYGKYKSNSDDEHFLPIETEDLISIQDNITEVGYKILNQKIWLSKENIMTKEDFDEIHKIISCFVLNAMLLNQQENFDNLNSINVDLNTTLQSSKLFKGITECKYSYDIRLSYFLTSTDSVEY